MNCDDVFVILTRGPFPSGSDDDAAVERHLQTCLDCHRLAEALRPNDAALRDATDEREISALPGYWSDLAGVPTLSMTNTADLSRPKRAPRLPPQRPPAKNLNLGQFAAAVALGIVLAAALRTMVTLSPRARAADESRSRTSLEERERLVASTAAILLFRDLPPECRTPAVGMSPADATGLLVSHREIDGVLYECCSSCHSADRGMKLRADATLQIVQACSACHGSDTVGGVSTIDRTSLGTRAN